MVPQRMKDAAFGMGCTRTQVDLKVVLPTALPGILTGVMLAVARAAGEIGAAAVHRAVQQLLADGSLDASRPPRWPILIYNFSGMPFDNQIELAWAASLVLVLIVLVFNILSRLIGARQSLSRKTGRIDAMPAPTQHRTAAHRPRARGAVEHRPCDRLPDRQDLLRRLPGRPRQPRADREGQDHRLHRPVGLRQEHGAAQPQPHERPDPRLPASRATSTSSARTSTPRRSTRWSVRRHIGMVFQQPNPFSMSDLRERGLRPAAQPLPGRHGRAGRAGAAPRRPCGTRSRTS